MKPFTFIDLFAGIGGFHLAMHRLGGTCVFASEIDAHARKTYEHNFKVLSPALFQNNLFNDDIRSISPEDIPDFDVLCGGFPCQPFSQAGHKRGFSDSHKSERGNLFFNIVDIIQAKQPKAFFLENVRGIVNHDQGKTFAIIKKILEEELGYSFYYKVVKASDYGLPQLRPRVFMMGFRDEGVLKSFSFPPAVPLKFTMSDVWGGVCSREIGFTLRVGGRGSRIDDRRNWDAYLVDGEVKKLMPEQARMMQGFPDDFIFPVPYTQAMKQLGNSVAVDAVQACGKALLQHMRILENREKNMAKTKNKGEWTELYTFLKTMHDKTLHLADKDLNPKGGDYIHVKKVSTLNIEEACHLGDGDTVVVKNEQTGCEESLHVSSFLNDDVLHRLVAAIGQGRGTFHIPEFDVIQDRLGISIIRGGNSDQKSDIVLDIEHQDLSKENEGFGIKSYLGHKPTLLNASGNTNFIFSVQGLTSEHLDVVNSIDGRTKLKDRIEKIYSLGGSFVFHKVERETMHYNLSMVDSMMPDLLAKMLMVFFIHREAKLKDNLDYVIASPSFSMPEAHDVLTLQVKVKRLLVAILLGFFAGSKWDGNYLSHGIIVVKEDGEQVAFHMMEKAVLEDYLFEHIKFDTPSTTRHRYGALISEGNNEFRFKLNLQLRF
ncbi:MAG: HpaII family restriction endonuclease [Mariprofundaceae bacterium]|nr:HpaII family restriction endonuclease [Mariprofundaceae bacterium]